MCRFVVLWLLLESGNEQKNFEHCNLCPDMLHGVSITSRLILLLSPPVNIENLAGQELTQCVTSAQL
jgi:hypothetical protein